MRGWPRSRGLLVQAGVLAAAVGAAILLLRLALDGMAQRGVKTGFGFLSLPANFAIAESAIPYSPADSYARALAVGLVNTAIIASIGIVLATVIGTLIGIARRSWNLIISALSAAYVEALRNVPLLVQLIIWWDLLKLSAPGPRLAWQPLPHVFVSNRGIAVPVPQLGLAPAFMLAAATLGLVVTIALARRARSRGRDFAFLPIAAALVVGPPILVALAMGGEALQFDLPVLKGFNFAGGHVVSPEFTAMLVGLSLYTSSYIAEIVRGGLAAVGRGQAEAAAALGLRGGQVLRLVTLPQALRVIIPPLIGQYLSLTKNSSLGVAIAFPDLISVGNTVLNQTGQAVEVIAIEMGAYLTLSLAISAAMNAYNLKIARTGTALGAGRAAGAGSAAARHRASSVGSQRFRPMAWLRSHFLASRGDALATLAGLAVLALSPHPSPAGSAMRHGPRLTVPPAARMEAPALPSSAAGSASSSLGAIRSPSSGGPHG